jgi:hypothetical protein
MNAYEVRPRKDHCTLNETLPVAAMDVRSTMLR